jgi:hypothetical protein
VDSGQWKTLLVLKKLKAKLAKEETPAEASAPNDALPSSLKFKT